MDRAVANDRRHELFARSLRIAQDTALRDKRRALGRTLAAGVMGDDARIDEEQLFMRAVDDLDESHIRLLGRVAAKLQRAINVHDRVIVRVDFGADFGADAPHVMILLVFEAHCVSYDPTATVCTVRGNVSRMVAVIGPGPQFDGMPATSIEYPQVPLP
jgi:hypothetical protein